MRMSQVRSFAMVLAALWLATGCGQATRPGFVVGPSDTDSANLDMDGEDVASDLGQLDAVGDTLGPDSLADGPQVEPEDATSDQAAPDLAGEDTPTFIDLPGVDANADDELAFQAALGLYDAQQYAEAQAAFEQFLKDYPSSVRVDNAAYLVARCQFELLQFADAQALFSQFLLAYPSSSFVDDASYYKARCAFELGQYSAALSQFQAFIAGFPSSPLLDYARFYAGRSAFTQGSFGPAITFFDAVISSSGSPVRDGALLWAGRSAYDWGVADGVPTSIHFTQAETYFTTLFADYATSIYVDNGKYYYGLCAYQMELYAQAIERLDAVRNDYASSVYLDDAWYYIARAYYKMGDYAKASVEFGLFETAFTDSVYLDNVWYYDARSQYELGVSTSQNNYFVEAVKRFDVVTGTYASSVYADNAWYYKLLSHLALGNCVAAQNDVTALQQGYAGSTYVSKAQAKLAGSGC